MSDGDEGLLEALVKPLGDKKYAFRAFYFGSFNTVPPDTIGLQRKGMVKGQSSNI